jgi:anti-sigma factor RsiW
MTEAFAQYPPAPPAELAEHLAHCPHCREEFAQLEQTLQQVQAVREPDSALPDDLWAKLDSRLDTVVQEPLPSAEPWPLKTRLMAEYAYLTLLGICLWGMLTNLQPYFLQALEQAGIPVSEAFLAEYGVFLLFFAFGGLIAMIATPILAGNASAKAPIRRWLAFTQGSLRLLAC